MKTYEITFEEIKENCKHYIVDGLHQCVVVTMRDEQNNCIKFTANQCCEATCHIIKKLKEASNGHAKV